MRCLAAVFNIKFCLMSGLRVGRCNEPMALVFVVVFVVAVVVIVRRLINHRWHDGMIFNVSKQTKEMKITMLSETFAAEVRDI